MSNKRFKFGLCVSVAWLLIMIAVVIWDNSAAKAMKPNEWGDFFSGFLAPLAFLWLVLGYLQQGEELELSRHALMLQAQELKNSVEQQRELVDVTRQQLDGEREALRLERLNRQEAAKPRFIIATKSVDATAGRCTFYFDVSNAGSTVTNVVGVLEGAGVAACTLLSEQMFARANYVSAQITLNSPFPDTPAKLTISYVDALGQPGYCSYAVTKHDTTPKSVLIFQEIKDSSERQTLATDIKGDSPTERWRF